MLQASATVINGRSSSKRTKLTEGDEKIKADSEVEILEENPKESSSPQAAKEDAELSKEDEQVHSARMTKLKYLLDRSGVYSKIMADKMEQERKARAEAEAKRASSSTGEADKGRANSNSPSKSERSRKATNRAQPAALTARESRKRANEYSVSDYISASDLNQSSSKKQKVGNGKGIAKGSTENARRTLQPTLVTGAILRDYQLEGLEWMVGLWENGLNGILADEMGLGKTLQTISFLAHLREQEIHGPHLIVAPLSTIQNWVLEFERFTPEIPVVLYYGTAEDRRRIRDKNLTPNKNNLKKFPIVVTSFELIIRDKASLGKFRWKYIVVDEGHRLKNMDCKLIRELKEYTSASRLILTGTPLHNNLKELWSLLNFILPDIFDDLESFEGWFDFSDMHEEGASTKMLGTERSSIITQLHEILKPFLLRRLKSDVESNLPPKKEYLLYAPLTAQQKDLYEAVLDKSIRQKLMVRKTGMSWEEIESVREGFTPSITADPSRASSRSSTRPGSVPESPVGSPRGKSGTAMPNSITKKAIAVRRDLSDDEGESQASRGARTRHSRRAKSGVSYQLDDMESDNISDEALLKRISKRSLPQRAPELSEEELIHQGKLYEIKEAQKAINNMHLENMVMQLRKICCHPFLFDWPKDGDTGHLVVNDDLIHASGKMLMLNRLLDALFAKDHKVLIFSQFTTMLDVIEDWANEFKGVRTCRIDGNTSLDDRRTQMKSFNEEKGPDSCSLFLLSTRAGGLGINLVAADTVIFYDSDWNPQMDLQAQDRVHRIGQTKPVLIFRLVSANTVEQTVLRRAGNKRKLEALVIQQGKFKMASAASGKRETVMAAEDLLRLEGEKVQLAGKDDKIISDAELEVLLDRSPEAYARKEQASVYEVTETKLDVDANDELARLLAGEE